MKESGQKVLLQKWADANNIVAEKILGVTGTSDIWGCVKGRFFTIELKNVNAAVKIKPTPIQLQRILKVVGAGGFAIAASLSTGACYVVAYTKSQFDPVNEMKLDYYNFPGFEEFTAWFLFRATGDHR